MSSRRTPSAKMIFLLNEDAFFVSHRFELGVAAQEQGWEVIVAAGANSRAAQDKIRAAGMRFEPISFDRGGRSAVRDARTLREIGALYRRERPSIVHHVTIKPVLYGSTVARALGVPAVVNAVSGLGFVFLDPSWRGRVLRLGIERAYRFALSHPTSATIFQNEDDRSVFVERRLVVPERVRLVRGSGVDMTRFRPAPIPIGEPVVVLPARLLWDKGVGEYVEAIRILRQRGIRARFALVGAAGGTNPASIPQADVESWVREGIVEWWGHRSDMPEVFRSAHLVVLPSYREGMPLSLLEASACGRPSVTTDVPGCRDAIVAGETGWLVPVRDASALADAMSEAISLRHELERRGEAAAIRAKREFDRAAVVDQHLELYRTLLSRTG